MKTCPNCNSTITKDATLCYECGLEFGDDGYSKHGLIIIIICAIITIICAIIQKST